MRSDGIRMGLNHLQSLICTNSADDLRPLMSSSCSSSSSCGSSSSCSSSSSSSSSSRSSSRFTMLLFQYLDSHTALLA